MEHDELEKKIGHQFKDRGLLEESLRHSSYVNELNEPGVKDNERMEFLGDAALNLIVGDSLMRRYPDLKEGDLSIMRANLVNESRLADMARKIGLGDCLLLGKGEFQTNGMEKDSILADSYEALLAAVYLDGGFEAAFRLIDKQFGPLFTSIKKPDACHDYKSRLQEVVQEKYGNTPGYHLIDDMGPPHDKTFVACADIEKIRVEGVGKSKKMAEQEAARKALEMIADQNR